VTNEGDTRNGDGEAVPRQDHEEEETKREGKASPRLQEKEQAMKGLARWNSWDIDSDRRICTGRVPYGAFYVWVEVAGNATRKRSFELASDARDYLAELKSEFGIN
jgi:hypothetical protein